MSEKWWGTAIVFLLLVAVLLTGCGGAPEPSPTPVLAAPTPALPSRSMGGAVTASGEVVAYLVPSQIIKF